MELSISGLQASHSIVRSKSTDSYVTRNIRKVTGKLITRHGTAKMMLQKQVLKNMHQETIMEISERPQFLSILFSADIRETKENYF